MENCIYIHIPFCEKKCNYCAFCSFSTTKFKDTYLKALKKEINYFYDKKAVSTLYIGGGTPSLLSEKEIEELLNNFNINSFSEVTIEVNPHNLSYEKLKFMKDTGINRISLGVQNFDDKILSLIGRKHTKKDIITTINNIKKAGFNNISIDLMYGLPEQNIEQWEDTLDKAISIEVPHISLYGLKIEKGTYFYKNKPKNLPDDDTQAQMYEIALDKLKDVYKHYEFSNFAYNKNYFSKHNLAYWKRKNYLGFGLSASGFIENKRYTNTFNIKDYIENPLKKTYQILTKEQETEEEIFLGLRLAEGINFGRINKKYSVNIFEKYKKEFTKYIDLRLMQKTDDGIKLTNKGILVSNIILSDFIKV